MALVWYKMPGLSNGLSFNNETFFLVLLPFIIFESGFSVHRQSLFRNMGSILTFAVVGTFMSVFGIGGFLFLTAKARGYTFSFLDCMIVGSVLSSTDPVATLSIVRILAPLCPSQTPHTPRNTLLGVFVGFGRTRPLTASVVPTPRPAISTQLFAHRASFHVPNTTFFAAPMCADISLFGANSSYVGRFNFTYYHPISPYTSFHYLGPFRLFFTPFSHNAAGFGADYSGIDEGGVWLVLFGTGVVFSLLWPPTEPCAPPSLLEPITDLNDFAVSVARRGWLVE